MSKTIRINLHQLMRIHGNLSVSELARLTGIPQPTIHHILTGATKRPRKEALEKLSAFFSISVNELTGQDELLTTIPESVKDDLQISTVPLVDLESLKAWPLDISKSRCKQDVLINKKLNKNSFAFILPDTSMEPLFQKDSLLIFDAGKTYKDRDFAVVYLSNENRVLFNRLFIENNTPYLRQNIDDGHFKLLKLDAQDHIIGVLIEVRIQY